jgi:quinol monooxygenase YgiN
MATIVEGILKIKSGLRDEFVEKSQDAVLQARKNTSCLDFSVSRDPVDPNRVNIFEKWKSREALEEFRNSGAENDFFSWIVNFDVHEHEIDT